MFTRPWQSPSDPALIISKAVAGRLITGASTSIRAGRTQKRRWRASSPAGKPKVPQKNLLILSTILARPLSLRQATPGRTAEGSTSAVAWPTLPARAKSTLARTRFMCTDARLPPPAVPPVVFSPLPIRPPPVPLLSACNDRTHINAQINVHLTCFAYASHSPVACKSPVPTCTYLAELVKACLHYLPCALCTNKHGMPFASASRPLATFILS